MGPRARRRSQLTPELSSEIGRLFGEEPLCLQAFDGFYLNRRADFSRAMDPPWRLYPKYLLKLFRRSKVSLMDAPRLITTSTFLAVDRSTAG